MKRREFITLLGGAAATWPLTERAQQPERMRRIGVLMGLSASDPESSRRLIAFRQGLQELGWTDGRNVRVDARWATGYADHLRQYAAELIALDPTYSSNRQSTWRRCGGRPTRSRSCSRWSPTRLAVDRRSLRGFGGNTTGFTLFEYSQVGIIQLLGNCAAHNAWPSSRIASPSESVTSALQSAPQSVEWSANVRDADEIERSVATFARASNETDSDNYVGVHRSPPADH
jgi:putative ABC transport system substrate-binding protein